MNNTVEVVFVLDRSGSMSGKESDIIGGFNSMVRKQRDEDSRAYVSAVLFSDDSSVLLDRVPIVDVPPLTEKDYRTSGCTALLDACGDAIKHIKNVHKYARPEDRPDRTMFVIMTDGYENASTRYNNDQLKELVSKQKERGWDVIFIGADIDAFASAQSIGISEDRAVRYSKASNTYDQCFDAVGEVMTFYVKAKADEKLDEDPFCDIFSVFGTKKNSSGQDN